MAVDTHALTSVASVQAYLNKTSLASAAQGVMESIIGAVTYAAESFTGRKLKARDYHYDDAEAAYDPDNAILDGNGSRQIILPQWPINSVTTLIVGEETVPARPSYSEAGYVVDRANGLLTLAGYAYTLGIKNVFLSYNAGHSTIPHDLEQAIIEQCAWQWKESGHGEHLLGRKSQTSSDGNSSDLMVAWGMTAFEMLPRVKAVLSRYRRVGGW